MCILCHLDQRKLLFEKIYAAGYEWDEEKKELKKSDIPKFKVGDWIVYQNKSYKVKYNRCGYGLVDQDGKEYTFKNFRTVDNDACIWTIKDAKKGDVLVSERTGISLIFISKNVALAVYNYPDDSTEVGFIDDINIPSDICPAVKEQCDLLFSKIKETGYRYDTKKKELKKMTCWRYDSKSIKDGYHINENSQITVSAGNENVEANFNIFAKEQQARSSLAMSQISQIMENDPRFGGVVTDKEWLEKSYKYVITRANNKLNLQMKNLEYCFIAFHTSEQRELFINENRDLLNDYFMIDEKKHFIVDNKQTSKTSEESLDVSQDIIRKVVDKCIYE